MSVPLARRVRKPHTMIFWWTRVRNNIRSGAHIAGYLYVCLYQKNPVIYTNQLHTMKHILTISWPSWSWKTSLAKLIAQKLWYHFPENYTTRTPRDCDFEYKHITLQEYLKMLARNELVEILHYNNHYYGIKAPTQTNTVMAIDVVGLVQLTKHTLINWYNHLKIYIDISETLAAQRMRQRWESHESITQRTKQDIFSNIIWPKLCDIIIDGSWTLDDIFTALVQQLPTSYIYPSSHIAWKQNTK